MPPGSIDFPSQDVQLPFVDIAFPEPSETALREYARACQRHRARIEAALADCDRVTQQACGGGEQTAALQGRTADTFQQAHEGSTVDTLRRVRDHLVRVMEYLFQAANRVEYIKMSLERAMWLGTGMTLFYLLTRMQARAITLGIAFRAVREFAQAVRSFLHAIFTRGTIARPVRMADIPRPSGDLELGIVEAGAATMRNAARQMLAKLCEDLRAISPWRWAVVNPSMAATGAGLFDLWIQDSQVQEGNLSTVDYAQTGHMMAQGAAAGFLAGSLPIPVLPVTAQKPLLYVTTGVSSMARNMAASQFVVVDAPRLVDAFFPATEVPMDRFGTSQAGTGASWAGTTTDLFAPSPVRPFVR